jgi:hypothetical protein
LRLERLASVISRIQSTPDDHPIMSASRFKRILHSAPVADDQTIGDEDPSEEPFVEIVTFFGGSYRVLPGFAAGSARAVQFLLSATFNSEVKLSGPTSNEIHNLALGLLRLSEELCRRSSLNRWVAPQSAGSEVLIPSGADLVRLQGSVTFGRAELIELIGSAIAPSLERVIRQPGGPLSHGRTDPIVAISPILEIEESLVVLSPPQILTALRHALISICIGAGEEAVLASNFHKAVADRARRCLRSTGFRPMTPLGAAAPEDNLGETFLEFDRDKVAHLVVLTDSLNSYDMSTPISQWSVADELGLVESSVREISASLRDGGSEDQGVLHVLVVEGVGRWHVMGFQNSASDARDVLFPVNAEDLDLICRSVEDDTLAIWYFALARSRLRLKTAIQAYCALDEYSIYRGHDDSFYLSDGAALDVIQVAPGTALPLRLELARGSDRHGVIYPDHDTVGLVEKIYRDLDVPIYVTDLRNGTVGFLVETGVLPVWVGGTTQPPSGELTRIWFEYAETVAYWIWQCADAIDPQLRALAAAERTMLRVELLLEPGPGWQSGDLEVDASSSMEVSILGADSLLITATSATAAVFCGEANDGERKLVRLLLAGVATISGVAIPSLDGLVDSIAPRGQKKKLLVLHATTNPMLTQGPLPRPRPVQNAQLSAVLDECGEHLSSIREVGVVAAGDRVDIVNEAVAFYFRRLEAEIARLSSNQLVETLVAHDESLIRQEEERLMTLPTRIACFGMVPGALEQLHKAMPSHVSSAVASRFLIEYIVAQPPQGSKVIDLETRDLLMALASEIVNRGHLSDALKFNLEDAEVELLASGRLGVSREGDYQKATSDFRAGHAKDELTSAQSRFGAYWSSQVSTEGVPLDLESAFRAEFGFSLTEIAVVLTSVMNMCSPETGDPSVLSYDAVKAQLSSELSCPDSRAVDAVSLFSLEPRESFFPSIGRSDVYPWRFNRNLSYVRRPFLIREIGGSKELVVGYRNTSRTGLNLLRLCLSDRLHSTSVEMKQTISRYRSMDNEGFNDAVADVYLQDTETVVRTRVKKVASQRMARPSGDVIGDVDVLVVSPSHHLVLVIETKDFELARTPSELWNELDKMFVGEKSCDRLHAERVAWIRSNLGKVLQWLNVDDDTSDAWKVEGLIVISQRLVAPLLRSGTNRVVTVEEIREDRYLSRLE